MSLTGDLNKYDRDQLLEEYFRMQKYYDKKEQLHRIRLQELKHLRKEVEELRKNSEGGLK